MTSPVVRVDGLKELRKALREIDRAAPRELRKANKEAVERVIIPRARKRAEETRTNLAGRPTRLGSRGVATIRPQVDQTRAAVVMGGPRAPYAVGHEWGAKRYRQFPPANRQGYILYPTVQEHREEIVRVYDELIGDVINEWFGSGP